MMVPGTVLSRVFSSWLAAAVLLTASAIAHAQDPLHAWTGGADPARRLTACSGFSMDRALDRILPSW